ncbi:MAG: hypothetical protein E7214_07095 [Clostridium sp.]|nr:hypothetical protein [Clostridium sp.]
MKSNEKIIIRENKILKLTNVLIREIRENELDQISKIYYLVDSYVKSKKNLIVGPMINHSKTIVNRKGQVEVKLELMVQLKEPLENSDEYKFEKIIRVEDCLFARFIEKEDNLQYAYQKLGVYAFENDIDVKNECYTVFVKKEDENIVADIFVQIENR